MENFREQMAGSGIIKERVKNSTEFSFLPLGEKKKAV